MKTRPSSELTIALSVTLPSGAILVTVKLADQLKGKGQPPILEPLSVYRGAYPADSTTQLEVLQVPTVIVPVVSLRRYFFAGIDGKPNSLKPINAGSYLTDSKPRLLPPVAQLEEGAQLAV